MNAGGGEGSKRQYRVQVVADPEHPSIGGEKNHRNL